MKLHPEKGDYIEFIGDIIKHFSVYATTYQITLTFEKRLTLYLWHLIKTKCIRFL